MLTPNARPDRRSPSPGNSGRGSNKGSGRGSPMPLEQCNAALPVPPLDTQASGDFSEDGPRSTVMRPSPREMPFTPSNLNVPGHSELPPASPGTSTPTPHHNRSRRQSRVIISDDPGGISLRRVSVDHHAHHPHRSSGGDATSNADGESTQSSRHPMSRHHSRVGPPHESEDDVPDRSPLPAPLAAGPMLGKSGGMLMESVHEHMTPENPDIKPSFGEQDFSVGAMRRGSTGNALRRSDSRMTGGFMGSGEAGAYNYGDYADSESEDGAIHENTFAFIAVENDRLERERVIAIIDPSFLTWRHRWFCILEGRPHDKDETLALGFNMLSISFVLASCVIFCLQSLPINTNVERERSTDPYFLAETACIVFFILEAGWRVACVPLSHLFTGFFAIDIVTILGYFADLFNDANALSSVSQAMRLLRVFRVFKLSRYSTSLQMVFGVLKNSFGGLSMLVMPLALVAVVFSASIYLAEIWDATFEEDKKVWLKRNGFPAAIQSMPDAIWFTFTTITTVGYGDVVPETPVGKILAVLLMFVGVLTLSFPNIVLGANLQVAFKQSKSGHGIALYTRKIRKVGHVVAFIRRTQYWVAVRKAREAAKAQQTLQHQETFAGLSEQGRELAIRANYAFFPTHADFEAHRKPGVEPVRPSNLRHWTLRGVDPVHVLQTLLEVYSGVATASELYEDMVAGGMSGETRLKDVALTLLYLSESRIVRAFVLERNTTHMVVALMEPAVSELLLHAERADRQCRRSAEYARFVWKQTTGQLVPFTLSLLFNTYTVWSRRERYAEDDSIADLRLTIQMPEDVRKLLLEEEDADPMANSGRGIAPGVVTNVGSEGALRSVPSITVSRSTAIGSKKRTVRGDALAASIAAPPKLAAAADLAQGLTLLRRAVDDTNQSIRALEAQMVAQHTGKAR